LRLERHQIIAFLSARLSEARLNHCLRVEEVALQLAERFGAPAEWVSPAALLHDVCREEPPDLLLKLASKFDIVISDIERAEPLLLHGAVGAALIREEFGFTEPALLEAVAFHITGAPRLSPLAKLVFVADSIEPGRNYPRAQQLREEALQVAPDCLLLHIYDQTIMYLIKDKYWIHPRTVAARNELLKKGVLSLT
jgi:predicted HD superfamily hydrolase involved in NAD metabolism